MGGQVMKAFIPPKLTVAQKRAMSREIERQLVEHVRKYEAEYIALALYAAHIEFGFGKKRLERLKKRMYEQYYELARYYDMPNDGMFIARQKLLDIGVDTTPEEDMRLITYGIEKSSHGGKEDKK
jgi:hypothetical protein